MKPIIIAIALLATACALGKPPETPEESRARNFAEMDAAEARQRAEHKTQELTDAATLAVQVRRAQFHETFVERTRAVTELSVRDLAGARQQSAAVASDCRAAGCEPDEVQQLGALDAALSALEARAACRASPECAAKLAAEQRSADASAICDDLAGRKDALADVAELKRNAARFGVVDGRELKDAADRVVEYETRLRDRTAAFRATWQRAPELCATR